MGSNFYAYIQSVVVTVLPETEVALAHEGPAATASSTVVFNYKEFYDQHVRVQREEYRNHGMLRRVAWGLPRLVRSWPIDSTGGWRRHQ